MTAPGYGREIWCLDSIITGRYVTGWRVVAQALYRRITTPRGTVLSIGNPEAAAYGFDICEYIGAVGYPTALAALPSLVRGEFMKDGRVADATVEAFEERASNGEIYITLSAVVVLVDEGETFQFTADVTAESITDVVFAEAA